MRAKAFQLEVGLTLSLWDLFGSTGPCELALETLARCLPSDNPRVARFLERAGRRVMSMAPRRPPCPDLALVTVAPDDERSEILAIIEVKTGAGPNWPLQSSAVKLEQLDGPVAAEITDFYFGEDPGWIGMTMCQTDLYRSRNWWHPSDMVFWGNPDEVLWLIFDSYGRNPADTFSDSARPDEWLTVDLKLFAEHLRELRASMILTKEHQDTVAAVLWHLDRAPSPIRAVAELPQAEEKLQGPLDEPAITR